MPHVTIVRMATTPQLRIFPGGPHAPARDGTAGGGAGTGAAAPSTTSAAGGVSTGVDASSSGVDASSSGGGASSPGVGASSSGVHASSAGVDASSSGGGVLMSLTATSSVESLRVRGFLGAGIIRGQ